jgi:hypothetical protein
MQTCGREEEKEEKITEITMENKSVYSTEKKKKMLCMWKYFAIIVPLSLQCMRISCRQSKHI